MTMRTTSASLSHATRLVIQTWALSLRKSILASICLVSFHLSFIVWVPPDICVLTGEGGEGRKLTLSRLSYFVITPAVCLFSFPPSITYFCILFLVRHYVITKIYSYLIMIYCSHLFYQLWHIFSGIRTSDLYRNLPGHAFHNLIKYTPKSFFLKWVVLCWHTGWKCYLNNPC